MKLYYSPGACSLAPHIALREAGLDIALAEVDLGTKQVKGGGDFRQVNPKGAVPALVLESGEVLTEVTAILQYLADKNPGATLAPASGTARYRLLEWLSYIATELHKSFWPLFNLKLPESAKPLFLEALATRFDYLAAAIAGRGFLLGAEYSIADAYLYTVLTWARHVGIDLGRWPALKDYMKRVRARPAVEAALKAEGLLK
jgi:glutathione S-transferase